ncbi:hypothetical protein [Kurthia massiliensis]|uniref:hypothetical protein n=1 Tax=Kurthia massiliensis TaxID=1033739 RepID=UPI00164DB25E|nr:hypothetical protein [Kurthia massiliensis]
MNNLRIIVFFMLGIIISLGLVTYLEEVGIMVIVGIALGGLFNIIYRLEKNYKK